MESKMFIVGLALGMVGGALIVANSRKARQVVKDSQDEIMRKADEISKNCTCHKDEGEVKTKDTAKIK